VKGFKAHLNTRRNVATMITARGIDEIERDAGASVDDKDVSTRESIGRAHDSRDPVAAKRFRRRVKAFHRQGGIAVEPDNLAPERFQPSSEAPRGFHHRANDGVGREAARQQLVEHIKIVARVAHDPQQRFPLEERQFRQGVTYIYN
jgi:hypothetical protein